MTRARKAVRDSATVLATQGVVVASGIVFLAVLTRTLSEIELASWALVEPLLAMTGALTALGLMGTLVQRLPVAIERGDRERARWFVRVALGSQLLALPVAGLAAWGAPVLSQVFLKSPEHAGMIRVLALLLVTGRFHEQTLLVLIALDRIRLASAARAVHDVGIRLVALVVLLATSNVIAFFVTFAVLEIVLVAAVWVLERAWWFGAVRAGSIRELARHSLPFYLNGFLRLGTLHADKLAVGALLGPAELAIYFIACRFYNYLVAFADALLGPALPKLSAVKAYGRARMGATLARASRFTLLAILPIAAHVAAAAAPLLLLIAGPRYEAGAPILALFCGSAVLYAMHSLYGAVIYVAAEPRRTVWLEAVGSAVGLAGIVTLGSTVGLVGVVIARVIGGAVMVLLGARLVTAVADRGIDFSFLRGLMLRLALPITGFAVVVSACPRAVLPLAAAMSAALCAGILLRWAPREDLDLLELAAPVRAQAWLRIIRRRIGHEVGVSA
jgi:O-antigen/teichoic acid export membrane protein